ncbi:dihydroneopterin aldolase [Metabacillus sp. RGM 3146]|uniref:dihydroneopterin aldolase n=1 Tax=Metabacillus sp. RGM 3146 TaxID=3401092 RepID=UPI003B9B8694
MDKIFVNGMEFYGYHGVFKEENKLGQRFRVNLIVEKDLIKAGQTDELEYTVNYGELYNLCKGVMEGKPYKLVESLAEKIATTILDQFPDICQTTIKIIKPDPPIPGHYESVAVEITRGRA